MSETMSGISSGFPNTKNGIVTAAAVEKLLRLSAYMLPDDPTGRGWKPSEIRKAQYKPHVELARLLLLLEQAMNNGFTVVNTKIGNLSQLTTTWRGNLVGAINELDGDIGSPADLSTLVTSSLVAAINEVVDTVGYRTEALTTEDKSSLVAAINELEAAIEQVDRFIGDLSQLPTEDKVDLVTAITAMFASMQAGLEGVVRDVGQKDELITTDKSNLVSAINELVRAMDLAAFIPRPGPNGNWWINGEDTGVDATPDPPYVGENGNWWVNGEDMGVDATPEDGGTPYVGANGNWWVGEIDTGKPSRGIPGITPHIGANGNWWLGDTDTGVDATPADGLTPHIGTNYNWYIGNMDTGVRAWGQPGMFPLRDLGTPAAQDIVLMANVMTKVVSAGNIPYRFTLGAGEVGYDNEWGLIFTVGNTATGPVMPNIRWGLGITPTFAVNTTTMCRLYYIGETLCGEWVAV